MSATRHRNRTSVATVIGTLALAAGLSTAPTALAFTPSSTPDLNPAALSSQAGIPVVNAPGPVGNCHIEAIRADIQVDAMNVVTFCNGTWATVGTANSDYILHAKWTGTKWYLPPFDGVTTTGLERGCYTADSIRHLGAPNGLLTECVPGQSQLH